MGFLQMKKVIPALTDLEVFGLAPNGTDFPFPEVFPIFPYFLTIFQMKLENYGVFIWKNPIIWKLAILGFSENFEYFLFMNIFRKYDIYGVFANENLKLWGFEYVIWELWGFWICYLRLWGFWICYLGIMGFLNMKFENYGVFEYVIWELWGFWICYWELWGFEYVIWELGVFEYLIWELWGFWISYLRIMGFLNKLFKNYGVFEYLFENYGVLNILFENYGVFEYLIWKLWGFRVQYFYFLQNFSFFF